MHSCCRTVKEDDDDDDDEEKVQRGCCSVTMVWRSPSSPRARCSGIIYWGRLFSGTRRTRGWSFADFPDVGHFKAPRGLTRLCSRTRFSRSAAQNTRWQRSNNTDLSHAKCDFISSSACPKPLLFNADTMLWCGGRAAAVAPKFNSEMPPGVTHLPRLPVRPSNSYCILVP